jgi:hypothetical protein
VLRFTLILTGVSLFIIAMTLMAVNFGWMSLPSFFYPTLILLFFSTVVIYRYLCRVNEPSHFTQMFLLLMMVKLIAYLGYNILMVLEDRKGATANVLFFLILYFVFTGIEIVFLYRLVTAKPPSQVQGKNF